MCGPAALLIASTAVTAIGAGASALQASGQAKYQAKIAERNTSMEREAAQQEIMNTQQEAQAQYRQIGQATGQQRARAAAAGVGVDYGTAAQVQSDTQLLGREDVNRIYQQGNENLKGRDIQASNYEATANASRSQASGALIKGAFDVGSTLLSGARQYDKMRTAQGKKGLFG